jgi:hypothetical protein
VTEIDFSIDPHPLDTARHEAGHAVVALLLGGKVGGIERLNPDEDELERWAVTRASFRFEDYVEKATQALAGPVAQFLSEAGGPAEDEVEQLGALIDYLDEVENITPDYGDFGSAWEELAILCDFERYNPAHYRESSWAWQWLIARTYRAVTEGWALIERVAADFLDRGTVSGERLREIVFAEGGTDATTP